MMMDMKKKLQIFIKKYVSSSYLKNKKKRIFIIKVASVNENLKSINYRPNKKKFASKFSRDDNKIFS